MAKQQKLINVTFKFINQITFQPTALLE